MKALIYKAAYCLIYILITLTSIGQNSKLVEDTKTKSFNNVDSIPYATLYVYRTGEFAGSLMGLDLQLKNGFFNTEEGITLGTIKNNSKMVIKLYQEGKNELFMYTELSRSVFIKVKFGQPYYLKVGLTPGVVMARPTLQLIEPKQGVMDFENIENLIKDDVHF